MEIFSQSLEVTLLLTMIGYWIWDIVITFALGRNILMRSKIQTHVICFLGSDDGKKENSAREGVESRFAFRANQ